MLSEAYGVDKATEVDEDAGIFCLNSFGYVKLVLYFSIAPSMSCYVRNFMLQVTPLKVLQNFDASCQQNTLEIIRGCSFFSNQLF